MDSCLRGGASVRDLLQKINNLLMEHLRLSLRNTWRQWQRQVVVDEKLFTTKTGVQRRSIPAVENRRSARRSKLRNSWDRLNERA